MLAENGSLQVSPTIPNKDAYRAMTSTTARVQRLRKIAPHAIA
jgi:hypothetical protein